MTDDNPTQSSWASRQQRLAYVCAKCAKDGQPSRTFLFPGDPEPPKCRLHNTKMERQENKRYEPGP